MLLIAAETAPAGVRRCPLPDGAKVERRSATSVVYSVETSPPPAGIAYEAVVYGCLKRTGRRRAITRWSDGEFGPSSRPSLFRASGNYVAFVRTTSDRYGTKTVHLSVWNLRRGREARNLTVGYGSVSPGYGPEVASLVVTRSGAIAFIGRREDAAGRFTTVLDAVDASGERRLAEGPGIDPSFLRLRGSTLSWRDANAVRSTVLR